MNDDTITAQITAKGGGKRGIIRISGDKCLAALSGIFEPPLGCECESRIVQGKLYPWKRDYPSAPCSIYFWPEKRSFTGEKTVELHTIGSQALLDATIRSICEAKSVRLAKNGEFTLRAFLSGRINLIQAEAILGVIEADDAQSLSAALSQLAGGISTKIMELHGILFDTLCNLEAGLDFADEHIEFVDKESVVSVLTELLNKIELIEVRLKEKTSTDNFPIVVLLGSPNAGKSSLFNALANEDKAIVSNIPGTTRDYLEAEFNWNGMRFKLIDTAGVENSAEFPEIAKNAALVLHCTEYGEEIDTSSLLGKKQRVNTKSDLHVERNGLCVSSKSGEGLEQLKAQIQTLIRSEIQESDVVHSTAVRVRIVLKETSESLRKAIQILSPSGLMDESLVAAEIRTALDYLGQILGLVYTEDILDGIFSRFCIGK